MVEQLEDMDPEFEGEEVSPEEVDQVLSKLDQLMDQINNPLLREILEDVCAEIADLVDSVEDEIISLEEADEAADNLPEAA